MTFPNVKRDKQVYANMCAKLHPTRIKSSDKMHWIISTIVGEQWVERKGSYGQFSITSDGGVIDNDFYVGHVSDFERNVRGYVDVAELSPKQTEYFWWLYSLRVHDMREVRQ